MKTARDIREVPYETGCATVASLIDGWTDEHKAFVYYEFYDDAGGYHGTVAYRNDTSNSCHEWHTAFIKPSRRTLKEWHKSIGGTWVAYIDTNNQSAIRASLRGGMEDFGLHTDGLKDFRVLLITYPRR